MYKRSSGYKESLSPFEHWDRPSGWRPSSSDRLGTADDESFHSSLTRASTASSAASTAIASSASSARATAHRRLNIDLYGMDTSDYALISGAMYMIVGLYFYFFLYLPAMGLATYICTSLSLALGVNIAVFYLFDSLSFAPERITPENSNLITGGLIVLFVGFVLATFQNLSLTSGIHAMNVGVFGLAATFLFLSAMALDQ